MEKSGLTSVAAVLTAAVASACCILPALLSISGFAAAGSSLFGSAGFLFFAQHRLLFSIVAFGMIAISFYFSYRKPRVNKDPDCADEACQTTGVNKSARYLTWAAAILTLGAIVYPAVVGARSGGTSAGKLTVAGKQIAAGADTNSHLQTVVIAASGMNCKACANGIASTIETVPGVKIVKVDYPHSQFSVCFSPKTVRPSLIAEKITSLGYPAYPVGGIHK